MDGWKDARRRAIRALALPARLSPMKFSASQAHYLPPAAAARPDWLAHLTRSMLSLICWLRPGRLLLRLANGPGSWLRQRAWIRGRGPPYRRGVAIAVAGAVQ